LVEKIKAQDLGSERFNEQVVSKVTEFVKQVHSHLEETLSKINASSNI